MGVTLVPIAAAATVVALLVAGVFSGPDNSGTQSAAAAVIRATKKALALSPGTISVENVTYVSGPTAHEHPYTRHDVLETPAGHGPQSELVTGPPDRIGERQSRVSGWSYAGGKEEIYLASTNTIYRSSIWGPYLHPGRRPGTYVYRNGPGAPAYTTHPVPVTARQRRALLSGQAVLRVATRKVGSKVKLLGLKALPPLRGPADFAETLQQEIANWHLLIVRHTRVDGRDAIELAGKTTDGTAPGVRLYFDPTTDLPFKVVWSVGTRREQVIRVSQRSLPITNANQRLLSLHALHPTARIDRNPRDYRRNARGVEVFTQ